MMCMFEMLSVLTLVRCIAHGTIFWVEFVDMVGHDGI